MDARDIAAIVNEQRELRRNGFIVFNDEFTKWHWCKEITGATMDGLILPICWISIETVETLLGLYRLWLDMLDMPIFPSNNEAHVCYGGCWWNHELA